MISYVFDDPQTMFLYGIALENIYRRNKAECKFTYTIGDKYIIYVI